MKIPTHPHNLKNFLKKRGFGTLKQFLDAHPSIKEIHEENERRKVIHSKKASILVTEDFDATKNCYAHRIGAFAELLAAAYFMTKDFDVFLQFGNAPCDMVVMSKKTAKLYTVEVKVDTDGKHKANSAVIRALRSVHFAVMVNRAGVVVCHPSPEDL
jgi:hypothetical protein